VQHKSSGLKRWLRVIMFVVLLCLGSALPLEYAGAQQSLNLLKNPSFEGDYEIQCSFPGGKPWIAVPCDGVLPARPWQTVQVAKGWSAWWQPPNDNRQAKDYYDTFPSYCGQLSPNDCVAWHMPEFRDTRSMPQDPPRIRSGENSQKYFTFWSVHEGGVYQVVEGLRPGTPLRFSIYMHAWSATKLNGVEPNPHQSFGQTSMHMKIGIDPTGGTDPWSKDIIWSAEKDTYDKFERYEVQAVARANKVTVFTHSRPENPMEHNDVYLDDAEMSFVGGGAPSDLIVNPPPAMVAVEGKPAAANGGRISHIVKAGDTLFALALQYGVPVDQIMALNGLKPDSRIEIGRELIIALPSPAQPEATPATAPAGNPFPGTIKAVGSGQGTVCVQAFLDDDANGLWLASEAPLAVAGLHVTVLNPQGEPVAERTLAEAAGETCISDLPATTYRVVADPPPGYAPTWLRRWSVSLPGDAMVMMSFGVQAVPIGSSWPIGVVLITIGLIGATVGGVLIWRRRRQQYWM
jgi:LysM repeat protein